MLEVAGLQVDYGAIRAVHDASLTVAEGELVTLLGANGAGKSSTLMCIAGALPASAGSIRLAGAEVTSARPEVMVRKGGGDGTGDPGRLSRPDGGRKPAAWCLQPAR